MNDIDLATTADGGLATDSLWGGTTTDTSYSDPSQVVSL